MKQLFIVLLLLPISAIGQNTISRDSLNIGETVTFVSNILDEERLLNIYLPPSYNEDSSRTYPVVYLLDGSIDEDFIHISGLFQFCSFSWINIVPESIVVGISNVDRKRDFTFPTTIAEDKETFPTTGESAAFIDFIEKELQPLIEATYRTSDKKTLIGQSLGGLLAAEILITNPSLFTTYCIISPSLWWDNQSLLTQNFAQELSNIEVYVAVGKEGRVMEKDAKKLYQKIKTEGNSASLHFKFFKEHDHGDVLHQAVYQGLTILSRGDSD